MEVCGFTAASDFAYGPEHNRTHYPAGRSISENHVFPPSRNPNLPTLTTNKQTTILILATSHFSPLHSEVGSSAFSYVGYERTAIVKEHNRLRADSQSICRFLPLETASIFQDECPAVAA